VVKADAVTDAAKVVHRQLLRLNNWVRIVSSHDSTTCHAGCGVHLFNYSGNDTSGRTPFVDTGRLVAYLDRSDQDHAWAKQEMMRITRPLLTCEAVIAETLFLLRRGGSDPDALLQPET
jgi:hypothetical protein